MRATIELDGRELTTDLSRPVQIGIELDPMGSQPRHFGAPRAQSRPFSVPGFPGSVARGASCNCDVLTLVPHCNGTHTECVGHLTAERLDAHRQIPMGLLPALVTTVQPVDADDAFESTDPRPQPGDRLVTRRAIELDWPPKLPFAPRALVVRTLPNDAGKMRRDYSGSAPAYLSREAAEFLVSRGIEHLVVDLPSIDRAHDEGRLTSHRIFFGLPHGSTALAKATRPRSTVTELAFIPDEVADGAYLLEIQAPAIGGDAVPSRPLLYRVEQI